MGTLFTANAVQASASTDYSYAGLVVERGCSGFSVSSASLVGIYAGADGIKRGLCMGTAHTFIDPDTKVLTSKAAKIIFADQCQKSDFTDPRQGVRIRQIFYPESYGISNGEGQDDICLFTTEDLPDWVQKIAFYTGTGYAKKPSNEAEVVGYGNMYPPGATKEAKCDYSRKTGRTRVTYYSAEKDLRGRPCFRTCLKGTIPSPTMQVTGFMNGFDVAEIELRSRSNSLYICAHERQVSFSNTCSGAPLVFNTKDGHRVAGVFSQTSADKLGGKFEEFPLILHTFTPVPGNPWLLKMAEQFETDGNIAALPEGVIAAELFRI